jgi:protein-S-isoprenylcysteine O-methyltransferase Ste14
MTLMAATVGGMLFLIAPFAEEPWLRERFGPSYDEYAEEVPRFLGACPTLTGIRDQGAA